MMTNMQRRYAQMLVWVGMNVQKGQSVLIESAIENWEFANLVAEESYKVGAKRVYIRYLDLHKMQLDVTYRSSEEVAAGDPWEDEAVTALMDEKACTIRLETEYPYLLSDTPDEKAHAIFAHTDRLRNIMRFKMRDNGTQWCIGSVPNQAWAEAVYPNEEKSIALDKLWNQFYKLCYLDETCDIVQVWKDKSERHAAIGEKLDALRLRSLHFTSGNGTDITIGLGKLSRFGMSKAEREKRAERIRFHANMPTEETCTTPLKYETNGIVYSTRPLLAGGKMIDRFWIRFVEGKAVESHAEVGDELLKAIIATDATSGYLGEIALVPYHSPISMSGLTYFTTLIDENASCHMALGRGFAPANYTENGVSDPYNDSSIHIDFMFGAPDTEVIGTTEEGTTVQIFKNGDFAL